MTKTHMVVHHSMTPDQGTVSWGAIRKYHVEQNGWQDIGYHFGVERVGEYYEVLVGRSLLDVAAAAYQDNMNKVGIHVCFIGNYDSDPPPLEMLQYAAPRLADACIALNIKIDEAHIIPHRQVATYKTCPGTAFPMPLLVNMMGAQ